VPPLYKDTLDTPEVSRNSESSPATGALTVAGDVKAGTAIFTAPSKVVAPTNVLDFVKRLSLFSNADPEFAEDIIYIKKKLILTQIII
jgi:hypothetical protein